MFATIAAVSAVVAVSRTRDEPPRPIERPQPAAVAHVEPFAGPAFQIAPQQAGAFTYRQLSAQRFRLTGNQPGGVVFSGAVSGAATASLNGNIDAIFPCPMPGLVTYNGGTVMLTNVPPTVAVGSLTQVTPGHYVLQGTASDDTAESREGMVVRVEVGPRGLGTQTTVSVAGTWTIILEYAADFARPAAGRVTVTDWYGLTATQAIIVP